MVQRTPQSKGASSSYDPRKPKTTNKHFVGFLLFGIFAFLLFLQFQDEYNYVMMEPAIETKVLVIGAGAAGLSAAAALKDCKVDFLLLEASDAIGGRIKKTDDFADHSIDLGPSFVYDPEWLEYITDKTKFNVSVVPVDPKYKHKDGHWLMEDYTWYDFFADHVAPGPENIVHNCKVDHIWHGKKGAQVSCGTKKFHADSVIVTAPLSVLQEGDIAFHPPLDPAIVEKHPIKMVPAVKVLLEFKWKFYPAFFEPKSSKTRGKFGWNEFYDFSTSNKESEKNVLAADFAGVLADDYATMTDEEIVQSVLQFLDQYMAEHFFVSENMASRNFIKARVFNWSKEPFIKGGTIPDFKCNDRCGAQDVNFGKLFLAGEAFPYMIDRREVGWVHNAAMSGKDAARLAMHAHIEPWKVSRRHFAILSKQFAEMDAENIPSEASEE